MDDARANAKIAGMMEWKPWPECHSDIVCSAVTPLNRCTYCRDDMELPIQCLNAPPPDYCARPDLLAGVQAAFLKRDNVGWLQLDFDHGDYGARATMQVTDDGDEVNEDFTRAVCYAIAAALEGEAHA